MKSQDEMPQSVDQVGDDVIVPFVVENLDTRGRIVQMGEQLHQILSRHNYVEPVAALLGEVIVMTALLGSSLKFDGKFIIQTQSDGPVDMLVADYTTPGSLRAYASFDQDKLDEAIAQGKTKPEELLGKGVLAMTVDQGANTQRYQGVVPLDGSTLEEIARSYFRQSEQIPTDVRIAVAHEILPGKTADDKPNYVWRAGGVIAQFLPHSSDRMHHGDLHGGDGDARESHEMENSDSVWIESQALMATIDPSELLDPNVGAQGLLYRLFHEQGVRVFEGISLSGECSCSREKISNILNNFTNQEREDSIENGEISVRCEFCGTDYSFDPALYPS